MAVETPPPELGAPCPTSGCPPSTARRYARDDFAAAPVLVRDVHLQPLPVREGGRGPDHPAWRASSRRAACSSSASAPTTRPAIPTTRSTSSRSAGASKATAFPTCTTRRRTWRARSAPSARPTSSSTTARTVARLAYRGRIDDSWKDESQGHPARARRGARGAARGQAPSPEQRPSMGCSIKWRQQQREQDGAARAVRTASTRTPRGTGAPTSSARGSRPRSSARRSSTRSCGRRGTWRWRTCCRRRAASTRASGWRRSTAPSSCWRRRGSPRRATSAPARRCTRSPRGAPTTIT